MIIYIPLLVSLLGCLVYALAANPKVAELGRIAFACGLLVFLVLIGGDTIRIGR